MDHSEAAQNPAANDVSSVYLPAAWLSNAKAGSVCAAAEDVGIDPAVSRWHRTAINSQLDVDASHGFVTGSAW